jgi:hypothetical protein
MFYIRFPLIVIFISLLSSCVTTTVTRLSSDTIHFNGPVSKESVEKFLSTTENSTRLVILTSEGGDAEAAITMGKYIQTNNIDIRVEGLCASSCANYLFLSGNKKELTHNSMLLFHGRAKLPDKILNQFLAQLDDIQREQVKKDFARISALEENFFESIPGFDIVKKSADLTWDEAMLNKRRESGFKNIGWFPTREILTNAGVENISTYWHPSAEELKNLQLQTNSLILTSETN